MTNIDTARADNRTYLIALTAVLGMFPVVLDSTIVNIAIVPIARALHTDVNSIQWIALGYLLSNAAVVSLSGYLGNRLGSNGCSSAGSPCSASARSCAGWRPTKAG